MGNDPMLDIYLFEAEQLIEQIESIILETEKLKKFSKESIDEIFRVMHTIKGSSSMMMFNNIANLSHRVEDLFYLIREDSNFEVSFEVTIDIVLRSVDFVKAQVEIIKSGKDVVAEANDIIELIDNILKPATKKAKPLEEKQSSELEKFYISPAKVSKSSIFVADMSFEQGCEMENIRAFSALHNIKGICSEILTIPSDVINDENSDVFIRENGFKLLIRSNSGIETIRESLESTLFVSRVEVEEIEDSSPRIKAFVKEESVEDIPLIQEEVKHEVKASNIINVNVGKLDKLLDIVGELFVAEAMVTRHPELQSCELDEFYKSARRLRKIMDELQDVVMSIRMVSLQGTFSKMHRIVRDMNKKLSKEVELKISGEDTEVDKNIIESLSDPIMHIIRNAMDHGIESTDERISKGKSSIGTVHLDARNAGNEVQIIVRDDGRGLNKEKIYQKALANGLVTKPIEDLSTKELLSFILKPGFSTSTTVTEFSGRGVGMDVVNQNIGKVGGSVHIDSEEGSYTSIMLKIPLTLAIIDGMIIRVGTQLYTIPIESIRESFRFTENKLINDPSGQQMIMVRGICYPLVRISKLFNVKSDCKLLDEGIVVMIDGDERSVCIFADELLGEQQVVVKPLPKYINRVSGISGCTLLGDGRISLIIDVNGICENS